MRITLISLVVDLSKNDIALHSTGHHLLQYFQTILSIGLCQQSEISPGSVFYLQSRWGIFSVSALCDVCREVHTMHNMAIDSVDYTHYTRVYTICEVVSARVWLLYTQTVVNI